MRDINILKNNGFDIDSVFDTFGDINLFEEILNDFYTETTERIKKLYDYKSNEDYKNYSIVVHSIKGECLYLGIKKLSDMSYEHQLKAQENDKEYINNHFDELINEINRVLKVICEYFKE